MANYYARVELHGADSTDYEKLHAAMELGKYLRTVVINGKTKELPTGSYFMADTSLNLDAAAAIAQSVAATIQEAASVVVVEAAGVNGEALEEATG